MIFIFYEENIINLVGKYKWIINSIWKNKKQCKLKEN